MPDTPPTYDPNSAPPPVPVDHPAKSYGPGLGTAVSIGGFQYDEATLHDLAKQWTDLANDFQADRTIANNIAQAKPPGIEYASDGNASAVRNSGAALLMSLDQREKYCRDMAARFITALGKYATSEEHNVDDIKTASGGIV